MGETPLMPADASLDCQPMVRESTHCHPLDGYPHRRAAVSYGQLLKNSVVGCIAAGVRPCWPLNCRAGDVPDVVLDDPDAHDGRREADRPDRVGLLGQDLPDLLDLLDPLGVFLAEPARNRSSALSISGSSGFIPWAPSDANHLPISGPMSTSAATGRAWAGRRTAAPSRRWPRARSGSRCRRGAARQAPLLLDGVELDADLLPLLGDHLADLRERHERPADGRPSRSRRRWPLPSVRRRYPSESFLSSPILSSSSFACLTSRMAHFFRHSGPGLYGEASSGTSRAGRADAEPERLVELVAVDAERERVAEVAVPQPLRDLGVGRRSSG